MVKNLPAHAGDMDLWSGKITTAMMTHYFDCVVFNNPLNCLYDYCVINCHLRNINTVTFIYK